MIPAGLLDQRATVVRRTQVENERGEIIWADQDAGSYNCRLDQRSTAEQLTNQDTVTTDLLLILQAGADIVPTDMVRIDGRIYHVVGEPWHARAFGTEHHVECRLRTGRS